MKKEIVKQTPPANLPINSSLAASGFFRGSIIYYKTDSYMAILTKMSKPEGQNYYGFVRVGASSGPSFVDTTVQDSIEQALNNTGGKRQLFMVDKFSEIE